MVPGSDREAELPCRLVLGSVQADEARQRLPLVEPERGAQVSQVERAWRRHDRHDPPLAEVEREVPHGEVPEIAAEAIESVLELGRRQPGCTGQMYKRPLRLESEQRARQQLRAVQLAGELLPPGLTEQQTQIR